MTEPKEVERPEACCDCPLHTVCCEYRGVSGALLFSGGDLPFELPGVARGSTLDEAVRKGLVALLRRTMPQHCHTWGTVVEGMGAWFAEHPEAMPGKEGEDG